MLFDNPEVLILLFGLAIVAGAVDTMAGGGGLLVVPGLLAAGLDPVGAFATNKLQALSGTAGATFQFWRQGKVRLKDHLLPALVAFLSAVGGAASLSCLDPTVVKSIAPFLLIVVALVLLARPNLGDIPRRARLSRSAGLLTIIPLVGFYDGFFGPGTGTFFAVGAVALLGMGLQQATINAKIYNFASNLGGLIYFATDGRPCWSVGAVMAVGTLFGGTLGAHLVLQHGARIIRPFVVTMSIAISLRILGQQGAFDPVREFIVMKIEERQPMDRQRQRASNRPPRNIVR